MFPKCFSAFSFPLRTHTQTNGYTQIGAHIQLEFCKITRLTPTSRSWKDSRAGQICLKIGVCSARFGSVSLPNNNLESERLKAGEHNLTQQGQSGIKIQMPVLYVGEEIKIKKKREKKRKGWDCTQSFKSSEAARGRHVPSGKLIMT